MGTGNYQNVASATEELNFKFHLILIILILKVNSQMRLMTTMVDSTGPHRDGKSQQGFGQNIFTIRTFGHICSGCRVVTSLANTMGTGKYVMMMMVALRDK